MTTRYCDNCGHTRISKYRLHSVSVTLMLLGNDPVHSAHVTATPLLSLIQLFLLRPCVLPLRFCDPRWLHYIKKERGKRNYLGVCEIKNRKPRLFRRIPSINLNAWDANAPTKERKQAMHEFLRRMRHKHQLRISLRLIALRRCLGEVSNGAAGKCFMMIDSITSTLCTLKRPCSHQNRSSRSSFLASSPSLFKLSSLFAYETRLNASALTRTGTLLIFTPGDRLRDRTALATSSRMNSTLESDVVYILCIAFMCRSDSDPRRGRRSDVGRSGREDFGALDASTGACSSRNSSGGGRRAGVGRSDCGLGTKEGAVAFSAKSCGNSDESPCSCPSPPETTVGKPRGS